MSLTTPAGGAALEVLGQGLSALLYALLFLHLLRAGPARWGSARTARWFMAAVGITALWSAASALDPLSQQALPAYLAAGLDSLRYAAWIGLLWMLMRPAAQGGATDSMMDGLKELLFGRTGPRGGQHDGLVQTMAKSTVRTVGNNLGKEILRGVLGGILGNKKR